MFSAVLAATVLAAVLLPRLLAPPRRLPAVVLLGWDGADPRVIEDLLAAGKLPHLRDLRARGSHGRLRSHAPYLSPLLWTSLATGRRPPEHGVLDFVEPAGDGGVAPIGAACRRVKAVWEIASERRVESLVVNWWATEPPGRIRGRVVPDRSLREGRGEEEAAAAVRRRLARGEDARTARLESYVAETLRMQRALLDGLRDARPRLVLAYSGLPDQAAHLFLREMAPRLPSVSPQDFARFGGVVHGSYLFLDALLGELLAALPADSTLLLVSDHGFLYGAERVRAGATEDPLTDALHSPEGIYVFAGPGIRAGPGPTLDLYQVAPTVLALLDLPPADDMAARPAHEVLKDPGPASIASYEAAPLQGRPALLEGRGCGGAAAASSEALEKLQALGYLAGAGERDVLPLANYARALLDEGDAARAAQAFAQAVERRPHDARLGFLWLGAELARARPDAAAVEALARRFLRPAGGQARAEFAFVLVQLLLASGRESEAEALAGEVAGSGLEGAWTAWLAAAWRGDPAAAVQARRAAALDPARTVDTVQALAELFPARELGVETLVAELEQAPWLGEVLRAPVSALTGNAGPSLARASLGPLWRRRAAAYRPEAASTPQ